jgi:long-chain acyl-CoA synthetase
MTATEKEVERIPLIAGDAAQTIPGVLFNRARRYGDREHFHYFQDGAWQSKSWNDTAEGVIRIACGLLEAGLKQGDHVALISEDRIEWIYCDWAIMAIGGVTVPIYPSCTPDVVGYICRDSGSVLGIASGDELAAKVPLSAPLTQKVVMEREIAGWLDREPSPQLRAEVTSRLASLQPQQIATVIYTSGTTGEPKGVMLTHANFVESARASVQVIPIDESDVVLAWMPFSHVFGRMDEIFLETFAGSTVWLGRGMNHVAEDIAAVRPTLMCGVPRVFEKMHRAVYDQVAELSSVKRAMFHWAMGVGARRLHGEGGPLTELQAGLADRLVFKALAAKLTGGRLRCFVSGGAPLNEKVEEFFWILGVKILQGWGMTESTSGATTNSETQHRYRTVGLPIPGSEVKIAADGEILLRGPGVMVGYKNKPEATATTIVDGWLHTGDIGTLDSDGFLTITDRKKDLIKTSGGKYVAPLPIEAELAADRYVKAALVVGDARPYVVALLVPDWEALARDHDFKGDPVKLATDGRIRAYFEPKLAAVNRTRASFETVKYFALLPRDYTEADGELTPSLKPRRRAIQENFKAVIDEMYTRARPTQAGQDS